MQQPEGHFPGKATVQRGGTASRPRDGTARLQDRYQYPYFALLLYAHRLTGTEKYLEAARRNAELIWAIQNPLEDDFWRGAWPDDFEVKWLKEGSPKRTIAGTFGVRVGYAHNDYATYDGYRTMVMMYHLTKDEKYIRRIERLPRWLFEAQLGLGNVRGWNEEYGARNEPTWARRFETTLIDPRNFNRFVAPMLIQFYAMTGNEAYRNLFQESVDWLRSVEHPPENDPEYPGGDGWEYVYARDGSPPSVRIRRPIGGWSYKYTYDGREAHSGDYRDKLGGPVLRGMGLHVYLESVQGVYDLIETGGLKTLRRWFGPRPTRYSESQYRAARVEAARRATDDNWRALLMALPEEDGDVHDRINGNFLARVRTRPMASDSEHLGAKSPPHGASGLSRQVWRPNPGRSPYKPTWGWATWQYVWDVRLALGKIDAATAAAGGRGLEAEGPPTTFFEPWDVRGDWTMRAIEVNDWLAIPFQDDPVPVTGASLAPESMTLEPGQSRVVEATIQPDDASYKTMTWKSSDPAVATVGPRMLKDIDPKETRPTYPTEGEIVITGVTPGTTRITATTTDGSHTATCKARVVQAN
ncbi:MAG: Ig-like domain-containing protein [Pirellulaceae bacterium]